MRILYKFPSRGRSKKFFAALDNIHSLSTHDDWGVLATLDEDDPEMYNKGVIQRLSWYYRVNPAFGKSTSKIHACNKDMELAGDWDIVVLMSDDQEFLVKGFDSLIVEHMKKYFPDGDGVLHYPDTHGRWELSVLSIMGRKYYDRFNYLYFPGYESMWADNEYTDVAKILNCWRFIPMRIYEHKHHIWGYCMADALNVRNDNTALYVKDNQLYCQRKAHNFGINIFQ